MKYYIVDAFAEKMFKGNPAGVFILEKELDDETLQNIAFENNLAETAFVYDAGQEFFLRWFTPEVEIDLCGHATLASAFVITQFMHKDMDRISFKTKSGTLTVEKKGDIFEMDFPSRAPVKTEVTNLMTDALNGDWSVLEAYASRDLMLVVENEDVVKGIHPNFEKMKELKDYLGVIVTAKGKEADFVSRFFAPNAGIYEDPVTGSSHSTLIPFWAKQLNKNELVAKQLSKRGGTLYCKNEAERVKIAGKSVLYLSGEINI